MFVTTLKLLLNVNKNYHEQVRIKFDVCYLWSVVGGVKYPALKVEERHAVESKVGGVKRQRFGLPLERNRPLLGRLQPLL